MSIVEIINSDTGELTRIDFWQDYKVQVIKSHTISKPYQTKLLKEIGEPMEIEYRREK